MRTPAVFVGLIVAGCVLAIIDLCTGSAQISMADVWRILLGNGSALDNNPNADVVRLIRGPRVLTAVLAGASLGVAGLLLQTLFRNPLAGPYVVGVSAGASLGAALILLSGAGGWFAASSWLGITGLSVASGAGAFAVTTLMVSIARRVHHGVTLLIVGLMLGYLVSAVVNTLMVMSSASDVQRFAFWGMGSFSDATGVALYVLIACLMVGGGGAWVMSKSLDVLLIGESYAKTMGVPVKQVRTLVLLFSSVLAAGVTACCGPIAFLGLAAPHVARKLLHHHSHRLLVPATLLVGVVIALLANVVTQYSPAGQRLPLNAVLSLVGAPLVIVLIIRRQRGVQS